MNDKTKHCNKNYFLLRGVIGKNALIFAAVSFRCLAGEMDVLSLDFSESTPLITTISGSWKKQDEGILVKAGSRISVKLNGGDLVRNGGVRLGFIPPAIEKPEIPTEDDATACTCALKVRLGRVTAQVSEMGLSLLRMDPTLSSVDTVLATVNLASYALTGEATLALSITDRTAQARLNDSIVVNAPAPGFSFSTVEIATYRKSFLLTTLSARTSNRDTLIIDSRNKFIEFSGVYHPAHFNAGPGQKNHSFITWEGGSAAQNALFTAGVPDTCICSALSTLGATPGDNLALYPWEKIFDPKNSSPDEYAHGSHLKIEVIYAGKKYAVSELLHDENARPFEFKFAGNKTHIPIMRTGCIACLESCPCGSIDNCSYTMRDLVKEIARFTPAPKLPFEEEDEVTIRISPELHVSAKNGKGTSTESTTKKAVGY
jgi:hypothetical protein